MDAGVASMGQILLSRAAQVAFRRPSVCSFDLGFPQKYWIIFHHSPQAPPSPNKALFLPTVPYSAL